MDRAPGPGAPATSAGRRPGHRRRHLPDAGVDGPDAGRRPLWLLGGLAAHGRHGALRRALLRRARRALPRGRRRLRLPARGVRPRGSRSSTAGSACSSWTRASRPRSPPGSRRYAAYLVPLGPAAMKLVARRRHRRGGRAEHRRQRATGARLLAALTVLKLGALAVIVVGGVRASAAATGRTSCRSSRGTPASPPLGGGPGGRLDLGLLRVRRMVGSEQARRRSARSGPHGAARAACGRRRSSRRPTSRPRRRSSISCRSSASRAARRSRRRPARRSSALPAAWCSRPSSSSPWPGVSWRC